jgi:hypothetical protein
MTATPASGRFVVASATRTDNPPTAASTADDNPSNSNEATTRPKRRVDWDMNIL